MAYASLQNALNPTTTQRRQGLLQPPLPCSSQVQCMFHIVGQNGGQSSQTCSKILWYNIGRADFITSVIDQEFQAQLILPQVFLPPELTWVHSQKVISEGVFFFWLKQKQGSFCKQRRTVQTTSYWKWGTTDPIRKQGRAGVWLPEPYVTQLLPRGVCRPPSQ